MRVLLSKDMRKLDAFMIGKNTIPGIVLMENAAHGVYNVCKGLVDKTSATSHVFCGIGNNGGDGFAVARILITHGYTVKVYLVGSPDKLKGDAKTNALYFIQSNQLTLINSEKTYISISKQDIVIDALFGIRLSRNVSGVFKLVIEAINAAPCPIIAVDLPSGLNADTGAVMGTAVRATHTVTFQHPKPAHFLHPGKSYCGKISIQIIGIETGFAFESTINAYNRTLSPLNLPKRKPNTHKGSYGTLGLICSSNDMYGAGFMCAKAALKSGVGLLHLFVPKSKKDAFATAFPEAMVHVQEDFLSGDYSLTCLACGPGLSRSNFAVQLVKKVVFDYSSLPKILDADALNLISENKELLHALNDKTVLTPHPLEFSRLSGLAKNDVLADPISATLTFAKKHDVTTLLKLATSVACAPNGQIAIIDAGSPGMAKGGSGDVLTGIIGAMLAQGFNPLDSACYGAYIAGVAGEMAAQEKGEYAMSPLDSIDMIAKAINT